MSASTFAELGVPSELVEVLDRQRITEPFEIQSLSIPGALVGKDILGRAPTGSGKTLAFGLPLLARLESGAKRKPRGLILSPTRELAEQICRELEPLASSVGRTVLSVYGGTGLTRQINALRKGVDLLVACPGRLLDLINQRAVDLSDVDIVVVDEADRMADMGFLPDVKKLLDQTSDDRQTVLFSATLDKDVRVLVDRYQNNPVRHEVGEPEPDLSVMIHRFIKVDKSDRVWLAADIIDETGPTVIFVRTRHGVDRLARQLKQEGIKSGFIHGGRSQSQRDRALKVFVDGKVDVLVATDVAARGIHVDGVACVIHFDPPADPKDYVHRSGRTARAGAAGTVVSFLAPPQVKDSQKMRKGLKLEVDVEPLPQRKPRSSRPAAIDTRRTPEDAGRGDKKRGKTGKAGKAGEARSDRPNKASKSRMASQSKKASRPKKTSQSSTGSWSAGENEEEHKTRSGSRSQAGGRGRPGAKSSGQAKKRTTKGSGSAPSRGSKPSTGGAKRGAKSGEERPGKKQQSPKKRSSGKAANSDGKRSKPAVKNSGSKRSGKPRPKNRKNQPKSKSSRTS